MSEYLSALIECMWALRFHLLILGAVMAGVWLAVEIIEAPLMDEWADETLPYGKGRRDQ